MQASSDELSRPVLNSYPAQPSCPCRVNISVAIMPMAKDYGWSPSVSGIIQSAFFYGYMLTQIPGGYVTARLGGRRVLPAGVSLWSVATAGVPLLAGTLPGTSPASCPGPAALYRKCMAWSSNASTALAAAHRHRVKPLAAGHPCTDPGGLHSIGALEHPQHSPWSQAVSSRPRRTQAGPVPGHGLSELSAVPCVLCRAVLVACPGGPG